MQSRRKLNRLGSAGTEPSQRRNIRSTLRTRRLALPLAGVMALSVLVASPAAAQTVVQGPNGNYYEVVSAAVTWDQANAAAQASSYMGIPGHLVTITSPAEQAFVANQLVLANTNNFGAYIGLNDKAVEGTFEWVTGEPLVYTNWNPGEPNDNLGIEDCVAASWFIGGWNDFPCFNSGTVLKYVIEYDVVDSDGDGDGVDDADDNCPDDANPGQEDNDSDGAGDVCDPDDDNDGTPDVDDAFPFDPAEDTDTDGDLIGNNADPDDDNDGQSDADEVTCGSDPLSAGSLSPDNDSDGIPDCVDPDDDNDGIPDVDDAFPFSDPSPTVIVGSTDTGVPNQQVGDGANMNDLIGACAAEAENHGQFVSCVTRLTNDWREAGLITNAQEKAIDKAAAKSIVGK